MPSPLVPVQHIPAHSTSYQAVVVPCAITEDVA